MKWASPPDHGYSWVVLGAAFMTLTLMAVQWGALGVFLVEIANYFDDAPKSAITMIATCHTVVGLCLGFPIGLLVRRYGPRTMTMLATALASLGYIITYMHPTLPTLYGAFGIIPSVAFAVMFASANTAVQQYFDKRRGLASGATMAGISLGVIIWPTAAELIITVYSWKAALLVFAGIVLNVAICGALFRPVDHEAICKATLREAQNAQDKRDIKDLDTNTNKVAVLTEERTEFQKCILSYIPYFAFLLGTVMIHSCHVANHVYMPTYAEDIHLSRVEGAGLVSLIGVIGGIGRPFFGWVADRKWVRRSTIYGGSGAIGGLLTLIASTFTSFTPLAIFSTSYGLVSSIYMGNGPALAVDILGVGRLPIAVGFFAMSHGVGNFLLHPLAGALIDATGSSRAIFQVFGVLQIIGGFIVVCVPLLRLVLRWCFKCGSTSDAIVDYALEEEMELQHT